MESSGYSRGISTKNNSMRIWLCDDDPHALNHLKALLSQTGEHEVRCFDSPENLLNTLGESKHLPDGIFLDILFAGETSIETGVTIHQLYPQIGQVYVTGHVQYAPEVFDSAPVYLLTKPIQAPRLQAALDAVAVGPRSSAPILTVRVNGAYHRIPTQEIQFIESDRRKLRLHCNGQTMEFYGKLTDIATELPDSFAQCHQSYLVNMDSIKLLKANQAELFSGDIVPVSQNRRAAFKEQFLLHTLDTVPSERSATPS